MTLLALVSNCLSRNNDSVSHTSSRSNPNNRPNAINEIYTALNEIDLALYEDQLSIETQSDTDTDTGRGVRTGVLHDDQVMGSINALRCCVAIQAAAGEYKVNNDTAHAIGQLVETLKKRTDVQEKGKL